MLAVHKKFAVYQPKSENILVPTHLPCVLCSSLTTSCIIEFFYDLFKNVPGEEVFNLLLSYSCDTLVVGQVQGRHLEPGGRGGAFHAGPTAHNPGLARDCFNLES